MVNIYQSKVNFSNIIHFASPTIVMMLFVALYAMVDGLFVANVVGTDALAAINIVKPLTMMLNAVSIMLATGGCVVVMQKMGEGKEAEAREDFTWLMLVNVIIGISTMFICLLFMDQILYILGVSEDIYQSSKDYLTYYVLFSVPMVLKISFEQFKIASGKASSALIVAVIGGILNVIFDFLLIVIFDMGLKGAALATGGSYLISGLLSARFFLHKDCLIYFTRPKRHVGVLSRSIINGFSEMEFSFAESIITFLLNSVMLSYVGVTGVSAITIVMYAFNIITSIHMGYSLSISPMISYYHGKHEREKTRAVIKISLQLLLCISVLTWLLSLILTNAFVDIFAEPGTDVYAIAKQGNYIFSTVLLFSGLNTFLSVMFTSFSNGAISTTLVFFRLFVFTILSIIILPYVFDMAGIWLAIPVAEALGLIMSLYFYKRYRERYDY